MIHRILAPTDGSVLSERALGLTETIARAQDAEVTLVRVIEPPPWLGIDNSGYLAARYYGDTLRVVEEDAREALEATASLLRTAVASVRTELLHGHPPSVLLDLEDKLVPDLVVMATHGRTALARFALGSVADRMVKDGCAPVLLVRPFSPAFSGMRSALVPLDGSPLAEEAVRIVRWLALRPLAELRLLRVVEHARDRTRAASYLHRIARDIENSGMAVKTDVQVDEPGRAIERASNETDIVVMTTHGRGGLDWLRHGSVAERATQRMARPVLLVRAGQTVSKRAPGSFTATKVA